MADIVIDGKVRVAYVPTITSISAPTTTELNAGTLLTPFLVPTGLEGFESSQDGVDSTSLASTFNTQLPGRVGFSGTGLVLKKQDGTDTIFNLITVPNTAGFIVIRANGVDQAAAWASAQLVRVYPGRTGVHSPVGLGEANSMERYRVPWFVSPEPNVKAAVA